MNLPVYIDHVNRALLDLTNDNFDLSMLPDYAEGENSLSDMWAEGVSPRNAARHKMYIEGMQGALNCWSDECDFCIYEDDCPHIG
jgi:hypothetical protein